MKGKTRIRAFVLAAGYGTRLRPLTLFLPKPLLPVCGEPVVGHTLRQLRDLGCEAVVLNLHHLAEVIPRQLGTSYCGLPLLYSHEEEIQGTLGALYPQRDFLAAADLVLLVNGDTLCLWPLRRLVRRHLASGADVTLLVHRRPPAADLGGGVGLDAAGRVVELRDFRIGEAKRRHVFAGAHVLSPHLLDRLAPGPGEIISDLYIPLLEEGCRLEALVAAPRWHDLGTPERYLEANLDWLRGGRPVGRRYRNRISPLAEIHATATVVASVVEHRVRIGEGARVEESVLLPGVRVAAGSRIKGSILGPEIRLPAAARIEGRMINRALPGHQTSSGESVMGDLIYTPLHSVGRP